VIAQDGWSIANNLSFDPERFRSQRAIPNKGSLALGSQRPQALANGQALIAADRHPGFEGGTKLRNEVLDRDPDLAEPGVPIGRPVDDRQLGRLTADD
jgi:hypothetical protein